MCVFAHMINTQLLTVVVQTDTFIYASLLRPWALKFPQHLRQQNTQAHCNNEFGDSNFSSFSISNKTPKSVIHSPC